MRLRRMTDDDAISVLALESAATQFPWSLTQYVDSLSAKDDAWVLEEESQLIGFIIFKPVLDETTLLNIAVHPNHQKKGYGQHLLELGLKKQADKGVKTCFLDVRVTNETALQLYRSFGFSSVGTRKEYYPGETKREDAIVMSRSLPINLIGDC